MVTSPGRPCYHIHSLTQRYLVYKVIQLLCEVMTQRSMKCFSCLISTRDLFSYVKQSSRSRTRPTIPKLINLSWLPYTEAFINISLLAIAACQWLPNRHPVGTLTSGWVFRRDDECLQPNLPC